ncbi:MAG: MotA/TolQ/ExbB proton channel family protein [Opitutales bacterium]|nr:MotA/TolQ/ExbB proton channel family protein [Opitutales bacterium]
MDFLDSTLIERGGPVMWPLLLLSLFGFTLFVERTLYLHKGQIRSNDFISGIKNLLRKGRLIEALTVCEETPGPVAAVLKSALLHHDQGEDAMRGAIQSAAVVEIPTLERRVGTLEAIARVAPLFGLLGTIMGLGNAFFELQKAGAYANVGILSSGFGDALITTATGLAISAMSYLAYHFLHGRVRALVHDMEYAGHDILMFFLRELPDSSKQALMRDAQAEQAAAPSQPVSRD